MASFRQSFRHTRKARQQKHLQPVRRQLVRRSQFKCVVRSSSSSTNWAGVTIVKRLTAADGQPFTLYLEQPVIRNANDGTVEPLQTSDGGNSGLSGGGDSGGGGESEQPSGGGDRWAWVPLAFLALLALAGPANKSYYDNHSQSNHTYREPTPSPHEPRQEENSRPYHVPARESRRRRSARRVLEAAVEARRRTRAWLRRKEQMITYGTALLAAGVSATLAWYVYKRFIAPRHGGSKANGSDDKKIPPSEPVSPRRHTS